MQLFKKKKNKTADYRCDLNAILKGQWKDLKRSNQSWCCYWWSTFLLFLKNYTCQTSWDVLRWAKKEKKKKSGVYLERQVLLGWGASALMQEDMALTEAACPLSKSNYDNHASGKAVARRTARQALIQQAAYLNHSSAPLQTPSSANVDGLLKESLSRLLWLLWAPLVMIYSCFTL